ncbi:MAG: hypothetical protein ACK56F_05890, partial [bacterium]
MRIRALSARTHTGGGELKAGIGCSCSPGLDSSTRSQRSRLCRIRRPLQNHRWSRRDNRVDRNTRNW